jgi:predicted AlkP superfamily phosphohydrolase/phosphomutase
MILLERAYAGADFLIQNITSEQVALYHTGVNHNNASPKDLLDVMNEKFGAFPSGADSYALEHGWITAEDDLYLLERQSTYMANVAAWVYSTYHPDLMLTWQDPFDSAGHQFLLVDPRQLNYSPELAETYKGYYQQAAKIADNSLKTMVDAFNLDTTTVMLVGDHGMAPLFSRVYVNTILENAGLLTLNSQNSVVVDQTRAFAICSGGAVHVYINLMGREKGGGTVSEDEYPEVQSQIVDLLKGLIDPETGEPVFQRVLTRGEFGPLGFDHPNSGDVFAQIYPGYHLDGWRGNDFIFEPADFYGQHGFDSSLPEMYTIFIAAGAGIPQTGDIISPVRVVDYAPTIASLLDFQPASTVDGLPIPTLIQP